MVAALAEPDLRAGRPERLPISNLGDQPGDGLNAHAPNDWLQPVEDLAVVSLTQVRREIVLGSVPGAAIEELVEHVLRATEHARNPCLPGLPRRRLPAHEQLVLVGRLAGRADNL